MIWALLLWLISKVWSFDQIVPPTKLLHGGNWGLGFNFIFMWIWRYYFCKMYYFKKEKTFKIRHGGHEYVYCLLPHIVWHVNYFWQNMSIWTLVYQFIALKTSSENSSHAKVQHIVSCVQHLLVFLLLKELRFKYSLLPLSSHDSILAI